MDITAIICEYNPFHNGHFHQIHTCKKEKEAAVIALMSGNFVQRGEPAYFSKFLRTEAALLCGADLVLEMPLNVTLQSAERFAFGSVQLLNKLGCVNTLVFGASTPNIKNIQTVASFLSRASTIKQIKELKKRSLSHPAAISTLVKEHLGEEYLPIVEEANNILGVEYCKSLLQCRSSITPLPIERKDVAHKGTQLNNTASATYLRELLRENSSWEAYVPKEVLPLYKEAVKNKEYIDYNKFEFAQLAYLKRLTHKNFVHIPDVTGGFEYKLEAEIKQATNYTSLVNSLTDKTHTRASIKRTLLNVYLNTPLESAEFVRVLGFTQLGEQVLGMIKKQSAIPFSPRLQDCANTSYVNYLSTATNLYHLSFTKPKKSAEEYTSFVIKK